MFRGVNKGAGSVHGGEAGVQRGREEGRGCCSGVCVKGICSITTQNCQQYCGSETLTRRSVVGDTLTGPDS